MRFILVESLNESRMMKENMFVFSSAESLLDFLQNQSMVVRILYDKNLDLYFACDADEWTHFDMIKQADKEGYYYNLEDFIDKLGALQNYIEYGVDGGYVYGEDGEEKWIDPYLYHIVFSPSERDFYTPDFEVGEDGYDKEYKTTIGRFLTRNCDLEDIDLYSLLKRKKMLEG